MYYFSSQAERLRQNVCRVASIEIGVYIEVPVRGANGDFSAEDAGKFVVESPGGLALNRKRTARQAIRKRRDRYGTRRPSGRPAVGEILYAGRA